MKFFIVLLAVAALALAQDVSEEDKLAWQEFKLEHGKLFLSKGKETERMHTFLANKKSCDEHNEKFLSGEATYVKGINKYSDLTDEDFLSRFGGVNMPTEVRSHPEGSHPEMRQSKAKRTPPASLQLTSGIESKWKVRDQSTCGSCWTFSTAAAVEFAYYKQTGYLGDLAEQQLVDCVYSYGGCQGGWMPTAMEHLAKNGGFAYESDYPYTARNGNCQEASKSKSVWLNPTTPWVLVNNTDDDIKAALDQYGVLAICVDASDWQPYQKGIFCSAKAENPYCSHAVALTGYGTENGIPFWTIRNSWGDSWWGEKGYMRLDGRRFGSKGLTMGGIMLNQAYRPVMYGQNP